MHILLLNQYGFHSGAPTGRILGELGEELTTITIVTTAENYGKPSRGIKRVMHEGLTHWQLLWKGARGPSGRCRYFHDLARVPACPKVMRIVAEGILGRIAAGFGIVFLLMRFDSTFGSAEEVEQYTDLPIVATIPLMPASTRGKSSTKQNTNGAHISAALLPDIVMVGDPAGIVVENLRSFRAALELVGRREDHRSSLFSSALPAEGKTFMSCNYAVSLAQQGIHTLLIDADLRRPGVHGRFGLKNDQPGLTEHVARGFDLSDCVRPHVVDNLDVMLTGGRCPNPAEFLGGRGFHDTVEAALLIYQRIVVDSPPINLVSDTRLIAPFLQTICLVVKAERTSRQAVLRSIDFLAMAGTRPVGVIFNCVPRWSIDEYYGHYYSRK